MATHSALTNAQMDAHTGAACFLRSFRRQTQQHIGCVVLCVTDVDMLDVKSVCVCVCDAVAMQEDVVFQKEVLSKIQSGR